MLAEAAVLECPAGETDPIVRETPPRDPQQAPVLPEASLPPAREDPEAGFPAGLPPADSELPTAEEIVQLKPRRVPSSRNREVYRQVKILERSERDVAREYGLTQPRVFAICKHVRLWTERTAGDRPDMTPEAKHNLAVGNARLRLSHTFSQAAKWLEVTGQPSQTERIKAGAEVGDVVKKGPNPKPAFVGYMLRAAIELAKLEGAYDQCEVRKRTTNEQACQAPTSSEAPPCEYRTPTAEVPLDEVLSLHGAELAFEPLVRYDDEAANSLRSKGYGQRAILEIGRRQQLKTANNCYRAVAEAHAPANDPEAVDRLEDFIIDLEIVAEKADALAWNDVLDARPPRAEERKLPDERLRQKLEEYRMGNLEVLLARDSDLDLTDESLALVMARYRAETGRFDWQLDTGRRDLASLLVQAWELEDDVGEGDKEG